MRQKKKNVILNNATEPVILRNEESIPKTVIAKNEAICTLQQVNAYFKSQSYPLIEAQKFYNYFQSNGWLVGGRTKIKDWQAAAKNWMINANKFNASPLEGQVVVNSRKPNAKQLHTNQNKNYNEPL